MEIDSYLRSRQEKNIILITHGWLLRLLELYFVQGKRKGITLSDLLAVELIEQGQFIKATFKPGSSTKSNIHVAETPST
jgi:hypothetical protein